MHIWAKGLLESCEMDVIIKDEFTTQIHNFYSNGGTKLFVKIERSEEALLILKNYGYINDEDYRYKKEETEQFLAEYKRTCPYCNSREVIKKMIP